MRKNLLFKLLLLLIPTAGIVLLNSFSGGNFAGGLTGSPGDGGNNCTSCHGGEANHNAMATITTTIPPEGYSPGQTYQVTVSGTSTTAAYGFQLTAEDNLDNKQGSWATLDGSTQVILGGTHMSHTSPNAAGSWTVDWTAPVTDEGTITFYAVVNAVNGTGNFNGDQVVLTSTAHNVLSSEDIIFADLKLYPNPAVESLNINLPSPIANADVTVYDYTGKQMLSANVNKVQNSLDVSHFQNGLYMISIRADGKETSRSFIKR